MKGLSYVKNTSLLLAYVLDINAINTVPLNREAHTCFLTSGLTASSELNAEQATMQQVALFLC